MKSPILLSAETGFILISLVGYYFLSKALTLGVDRTPWTVQQKRKSKIMIIGIPVMIGLLVSIWSLSGIMAKFELFPLNFMPVLALPLIITLFLTFSKSFTEVLKQIPPSNLIRIQTFRVFVEIVLWLLFLDGVLPVQMSFEGRNFDVLAGLTAPIIAWLTATNRISKTGLMLWNIACLALLVNIVTIAILSTPTPLRMFMNDPANIIVAYFPSSWLPGLLVPLAYSLHLFSLRQLSTSQAAIPQTSK